MAKCKHKDHTYIHDILISTLKMKLTTGADVFNNRLKIGQRKYHQLNKVKGEMPSWKDNSIK